MLHPFILAFTLITARKLTQESLFRGSLLFITILIQTSAHATRIQNEFCTQLITQAQIQETLRQHQTRTVLESFGMGAREGHTLSMITWDGRTISGELIEILPNGNLNLRQRNNSLRFSHQTEVRFEDLILDSITRIETPSTRTLPPPLPPEALRPRRPRLTFNESPSVRIERRSFSRVNVTELIERSRDLGFGLRLEHGTNADPYHIGSAQSPIGRADPRAALSVRETLDIDLPREIPAFDLGFDTFRIPDQTFEQRLDFELSQMDSQFSVERNATLAGRGGQSVAYFVHSTAPESVASNPELRRNWAKQNSRMVIILANPRPLDTNLPLDGQTPPLNIEGAQKAIVRRLALRHFIQHFGAGITFQGHPIVTNNQLLSTPAHHARGTMIESTLTGSELKLLADSELRLFDLNQRQLNQGWLSQQDALARNENELIFLQNSITPRELRELNARVLLFYRLVHAPALQFQLDLGLEGITNTLLGTVELPAEALHFPAPLLDTFRQRRVIGLDLNLGANTYLNRVELPGGRVLLNAVTNDP